MAPNAHAERKIRQGEGAPEEERVYPEVDGIPACDSTWDAELQEKGVRREAGVSQESPHGRGKVEAGETER